MGCFNFRCAISGLPIADQEKVRFMLVTENPVPSDFVSRSNVTAFWAPRSIPIVARYNDYGEIEGAEQGPGFDLMLEGLRRELVERPVGENYHDVAIRLDMGWDDIMTALWKDRVQVKISPTVRGISTRRLVRHGDNEVPAETTRVSYCMIRDDIWRRLLRLPTTNTFTDNELRIQDFRRETYKLYKKPRIDSALTLVDLELWEQVVSPLAPLGLCDEFTFGMVGHWKMLKERALPFKEARPVLDALAEFAHISMMLRLFGHQWLPSNTYGQQHGHMGSHGKFLSAMASVAAKVQRKWDAEDDVAEPESDSDV